MSTLFQFTPEINAILRAINDVLIAGIAVTSFSLLMSTFAFKLHDRLTWSYTLILACITLIYAAAAFTLIPQSSQVLNFLLHLYWVGLVLMPAGYFNFSDALLTLTGRPSRGRRKLVSIFTVIFSVLFLVSIPAGWLVSNTIIRTLPAPFLQPSGLSGLFAVYFGLIMILAWYNMIRALNRSVTSTSRRRMIYLVIGAMGPAIGSFPFLLNGTAFARNNLSSFGYSQFLSILWLDHLRLSFHMQSLFMVFPGRTG